MTSLWTPAETAGNLPAAGHDRTINVKYQAIAGHPCQSPASYQQRACAIPLSSTDLPNTGWPPAPTK